MTNGHEGTDKIQFYGRLAGGKALKIGHYKVAVTATNAAGQRATSRSLSFTIVK